MEFPQGSLLVTLDPFLSFNEVVIHLLEPPFNVPEFLVLLLIFGILFISIIDAFLASQITIHYKLNNF